MKRCKIWCKIISFATVLILCFCLCGGIVAQAMEVPTEVVSTEETNITSSADVIVTKFRTKNGKLQYRRWNETYAYWVDPYWINA